MLTTGLIVSLDTRGDCMKATQKLHDLGQSLWLDNITRDLLDNGTLKSYIDELSVTGLTSNPTIFDQAIKKSASYDDGNAAKAERGQVRRGAVLRAGARRPDARRRPVPAHPRPDAKAWMDGFRWKFRRCSPTTRRARWLPRKICTRARLVQTCSSRFPAPRKACPRLKRRSLPACPST